MTEPAGTGQQAPPPDDLAARVGRVEQTQEQQGSILQRILAAVDPAARSAEHQAHGQAQTVTEARLDRGSRIESEVEAAVRKVGAEQERQRREAEHAAEHDRLRAPATPPPPEQAPVTVPTAKQRLQAALFGKDPD